MNAVREMVVETTGLDTSSVPTGLRRRQSVQKVAFGFLWATGAVVILMLFFVIGYLLLQGGAFFSGPEDLLEDAVMVKTNVEMLDEVSSNPYALGYLPINGLEASVKPIVLNGVMPSTESVAAGWYPIVQDFTMVTIGETGQQPAVGITEAWLAFVLSQEGQAVVCEVGFVPLSDTSPYVPDDAAELSGELTIAGSATMEALVNALATEFMLLHPQVSVAIETSDSTRGIREAGKGNADIGMSARDLYDYEFVRYEGLQAYAVAKDGVAIVAHPEMPVGGLTVNQVRDLFTGVISNWQEVGGPDAAVRVISREMGSGAWLGFEQWVLGKGAMMSLGLQTGNLNLTFQGLWASLRFFGRFLTSRPLPGMGGRGGISTTIITTVYMVILTLAIATPLGVGAAIYLVEYAGEMSGKQSDLLNKTVYMIRFAVETLAGVPSILYGLFGFALFITVLKLGFSMLSGALAGACLILPTVIRATEEALLTVPKSYRQGSLALGATKWQTNYQVVLPAAMPGIVTGIILGVGRIISETAIFYVTLGGSINMPTGIMDQGRTMVLHLYSLMMDANAPGPAMGTAVVIIFVIILINLCINYFSRKLSQSMAGNA